MKNNKKNNVVSTDSVLVLGLIVVIAFIIGIINMRKLSDEVDSLTSRLTTLESKINGTSSTESETYDVSRFKEISMSDIQSDSKGKTIVVWLGLPTCGYCQAYAPLLADVADEYGITARYINVSTMTQEDYDTLVSLKGKGDYENYGSSFTGTPFTMIIKNGVIIGGINGYVDSPYIESAFEAAGLSK